jgi:hypothetical protein
MDGIEIVLSNNANDQPVYAYMVQGTALYNPEYSLCGRYKVDAFKEYGLFERQVDALHKLNVAFNFNDEV